MEQLKQAKAIDAVTFGEVLMRFSPPQNERIVSCDTFVRFPGGSELNIAAGLSMLGLRTAMITRLPQNDMGSFLRNSILRCGIADDYILYDEDKNARVGTYYYEGGAYPHKPKVVYDRRNSAINGIRADEVAADVFESARLFHTSGISLAVSQEVRTAAIALIKRFKEKGAVISFDVNFRENLWAEDEAARTISTILPMVDILFASEETLRRMFKQQGTLKEIMQQFCSECDIAVLASTERTVISPKCHNFTSTIYDREANTFYCEKPYEGIDVVDRIGSGDAYVAGVLFGLISRGDCADAMQFGNAMCAVKNTVIGDLPSTSLREIEGVIAAHGGNTLQSELDR